MSKKVLPNKTSTKKKTRSKKNTQKNLWQKYLEQRDQFFHDHQSARILLGLFLIVFSYFIANLISNYKKEIFIGQQLDEFGIDAVEVNALEK